MLTRILMSMVFFMLACSPALHAAEKPNDREALAGLTAAKVIFDVRVPDLEKLVFNLQLFNETFDGLVAQGVKPQMLLAFRGPGVRLLTASALDDDARELLAELTRKGVRIEVCALAMRVYRVDPAGLIPEARLVANVLNSLIGYQNRGYAMIAIN
jgi:intracellular sulfur oxidation DsrE/DsrF family protein